MAAEEWKRLRLRGRRVGLTDPQRKWVKAVRHAKLAVRRTEVPNEFSVGAFYLILQKSNPACSIRSAFVAFHMAATP